MTDPIREVLDEGGHGHGPAGAGQSEPGSVPVVVANELDRTELIPEGVQLAAEEAGTAGRRARGRRRA